MSRRVILLPEALRDATEAYDWYESRSAGLGDRFLKCVIDCLQYIRDDPETFEIAYKDFRRAIVRRFPYVIFYEFDGETVTIYSVFQSAQNPDKWRKRLSS